MTADKNSMRLLITAVTCAWGIAGHAAEVTLPFEEKRGHVLVRSLMNGSNTVSLMLDTGYDVSTIRPELAEQLGLRRVGRITLVGIAGEERADMMEGVTFDFAGATYKPRRVAALPSDRGRRSRDGILGSGFFRRFVVEIDPRGQQVTLHDPEQFVNATTNSPPKGGTPNQTVLPMSFRRGIPNIEGSIHFSSRAAIPGRFEIDTGCDGGLCLGEEFVRTNKLIALSRARETSGRNGVGGGVESLTATIPELRLGGLAASKVEANFFAEGSPVDGGLAGHIGWGVLRQFKVLFDYERRQLILEKLDIASSKK